MTRDVIVSISGLQFNINDPVSESEPIEIITPATYYKRNGKHYILYEEFEEDLLGRTGNKIKFHEGSLEVMKTGLVTSHMVFETGRKNTGCYDTAYGQFTIGLIANRIDISDSPDHIHVDMEYSMDINFQPLANCALSIDIQPQKGNFKLIPD